MVKEDYLSSLYQKLGRVTKWIYPHVDGKIRVVKLKTLNGEYKRPILDIAILATENKDQSLIRRYTVTNSFFYYYSQDFYLKSLKNFQLEANKQKNCKIQITVVLSVNFSPCLNVKVMYLIVICIKLCFSC